jgi:hypothetical protein
VCSRGLAGAPWYYYFTLIPILAEAQSLQGDTRGSNRRSSLEISVITRKQRVVPAANGGLMRRESACVSVALPECRHAK